MFVSARTLTMASAAGYRPRRAMPYSRSTMSSHDELGPSATKRIERSARRVVRATGLGRPARQAQGAMRQARSRLSEWVAPSESETALHERRDNAAIRLLFSFVLHADSICIDVGAHQGSMLSDMVRVAPLGRHIAYEPLP